MKPINFLHKLHLENKVQIVEPSADICSAYIQRSAESLSSAKTLLKIGNLKDAVGLSYYSMYHSLLALLFRTGIKSENHGASIIMLSAVFGIDNQGITKAKSERVDKQYYVDFAVTAQEVKESINSAEEFNAELHEFLARIKESDIQKARATATELIGTIQRS